MCLRITAMIILRIFLINRWKLTPAYDLTYSNSIGGEHACCVNGNGRNPGFEDVFAVGRKAGMTEKKMRKTSEEIKEIVDCDLSDILKER